MALIVMVKWSESIFKFLKSNEQGCTSMQVIVELLDGLAGLYYDFMFELKLHRFQYYCLRYHIQVYMCIL